MVIWTGTLCQWTNDSKRLILEYFDIICNSPSHIYHCVLPFSPPSSWLHKYYSTEFSPEVRIVKGCSARWGACFCTIQLGSYIMSLAYCKDTIAASLYSGSIVILNAITGSQMAILLGHTNVILSLAFSVNSVLLVSGSHDHTIKLWDVQTGGVIKIFSGHISPVNSVSVSADCTMIVSGSDDNTVCLWNIQTGECYHVLIYQESVIHVYFSPLVPQHLISISDDDGV